MATRRPREEAVRLGKEIYERDILPQVEADHFGEYVAIDVETGDWAVADTTRVAVERLRARRPRAVDVLCERVGYRALRSFGAGKAGAFSLRPANSRAPAGRGRWCWRT